MVLVRANLLAFATKRKSLFLPKLTGNSWLEKHGDKERERERESAWVARSVRVDRLSRLHTRVRPPVVPAVLARRRPARLAVWPAEGLNLRGMDG